jgi:hypothetical protein
MMRLLIAISCLLFVIFVYAQMTTARAAGGSAGPDYFPSSVPASFSQ